MEFPCDKCGLCCRQVSKMASLQYLDRGDGTCRHFDEDLFQCKVYHTRPLLCNVRKSYKILFLEQYTWEEFIQINQEGCQTLKKQQIENQTLDKLISSKDM